MQRGLAWDDLVTVLAIGRNGTLAGAARELRVNHSTMFRRIGAIEDQLGVRLFERLRSGYVPTPAGEEVIRLALHVDEEVVALERKLAGVDVRPSGTLRVTTTETLIPWVVPICARFRLAYPEIRLELVTGTQMLNLSRRDADVAIRPSAAPPESLHGRRLASVAFAVYGSEAYLAEAPDPAQAEGHRWIGLDDSLSHLRAHSWLEKRAGEARIAMKVSSLVAAVHAAKAGIGLALLPCYLGDAEAGLIRVSPLQEEPATDLWLLVHHDIRRVGRVRAFTDFAAAEFARLKALLQGEAAKATPEGEPPRS